MTVQSSLQTQLLNFRKMKHDFSASVLKEGKELYEKGALKEAEIIQFGAKSIKVRAKVAGVWANAYECLLEIDKNESEILDSNCGCPAHYDCLHLACLLFHLEEHIDTLVVDFFQDKKKDSSTHAPSDDKEHIQKVLKHAERKVLVRKEKELEKQHLEEYLNSASLLGKSAFFVPELELKKEQGEISFLFVSSGANPLKSVELQIALKLPFRTKPIYIQQPKQFFSALQEQEPYMVGSSRFVFGQDSFGPFAEELLKILRQYVHFQDSKQEKGSKACSLDKEGFGEVLGLAYELANNSSHLKKNYSQEQETFSIPGLFWETFEKPLHFCVNRSDLCFTLQYIKEPLPRLLLSPSLILGNSKNKLPISETILLESSKPGLLAGGVYHRFHSALKRQHLIEVESIQKIAIPEQLFGCFVENAMPELLQYAKLENREVLEQIVTIPHPERVRAQCDLHYAGGELEASLHFVYGPCVFPENSQVLKLEHVQPFITTEGILARNLVEENQLIRELFQGFSRDEKAGTYVANTDRKIVEFMTEIVPRYNDRVEFNYPETLQSRFQYDDTKYSIVLKESQHFDRIVAELSVEGGMRGVNVETLWDCVFSRKPFVLLSKKGTKQDHDADDNGIGKASKILVLELETLGNVLQILDELQIRKLENQKFELPLWVLVNLLPERFENLPIEFKLSKKLAEIQKQIFENTVVSPPAVPQSVHAVLRHYQKDGVDWLYRLRTMGLNGILADDMGLGKTLQAICAITQYFEEKAHCKDADFPSLCLIVCPTSLVDNWKEEFSHFNPKLKVSTVVGTPQERKKIIGDSHKFDVLITSYGLVQKDIELYEKHSFGYLILDEAQHIKNRETRNARSVKKIPARHKLILTGTPLENSLEDLWSLFDFLMPGLLGSYERFVNTYIKLPASQANGVLTTLKKKITPFVLRRMKKDVLEDLPPISHIVYHCHLSQAQQDLYYSYAKAAKENLIKLVEKEGFDKVRIHVLATLTRLKQICCHPAIFAKENVEPQDSAKYEMLLDLIGGLIESGHKTVVFSQYTKMLGIMREDLKKMGAKFSYLDGSSKNRLQIVKQFNEDPEIPIFLVSLKAGGAGLNLVGADTVIHYDMWWNPAVENQATDRVWRLGQKERVSSYKLITLGTIEEKILQLQDRKKDLLNEIVHTDEEVVAKLTWEEVLELLKT